MRIGVIFPHFEFGVDPAAIRDYAQTAEDLGFAHIGADDHVIGPNPNRPGGWQGWVTYRTRKERKLPLSSDPHVYEKPGKYRILVKVIDIFGNDTSQAFDVEVK